MVSGRRAGVRLDPARLDFELGRRATPRGSSMPGSDRLKGLWTPIPADFFSNPEIHALTSTAQVAFLALTLHANRYLTDWILGPRDLDLVAAQVSLGRKAWSRG